MNILIEIGHPAHVYKLLHTIKTLEKENHKVVVVTKDISAVTALLIKFQIRYTSIGVKKDSLWLKALLQLWYNIRCYLIFRKEKINFMIGGLSVAYLTRLTGCPSILFDDDDDAAEPLLVKYVHPYVSEILSPSPLTGTRARKDTIYYNGYHELAYLHPNHFQPDDSIFDEIGLKKGDAFFVFRFNAFKAHHDIGVSGLSLNMKRTLIHLLEQKGRVFITTEREIDDEFKKYQLRLSPEKVHSLLYYATMLVGDSQTMTSEAAVLGTPALKCNTFAGKLAIPNELEDKYQLCYAFLPKESDKLQTKLEELLALPDLKQEWNIRRETMLKDKIDVSAFFTWFIANYPDSAKVIRENPDYQFQFKQIM